MTPSTDSPAAVSPATPLQRLAPYLKPGSGVVEQDGIPTSPVIHRTPGLDANAYYFGKREWAEGWLKHVHRYPEFRERWLAATGSWENQIVVDVGCGPGNVFVSLQPGQPALLVGIDVSADTLKMAQRAGYTPLLADAQELPLRSAFADLVVLNATIHHCDDMARTLAESARLVKPGGLLIADHDPQKSAYDFRGLGLLLWYGRMPYYRLRNRGGHRAADNEQAWAAATEIHHKPGDGLTADFFRQTLEPLGFDVQLYPHNHRVGAAALAGEIGRAPLKMRIAQRLSWIDPSSEAGALSLMCVARRRDADAGPTAAPGAET